MNILLHFCGTLFLLWISRTCYGMGPVHQEYSEQANLSLTDSSSPLADSLLQRTNYLAQPLAACLRMHTNVQACTIMQ